MIASLLLAAQTVRLITKFQQCSALLVTCTSRAFCSSSTLFTMVEESKRLAAYRAIEENVTSDTKVIGIGSGSTIVYAVDRLAELMKNTNLSIVCVPTSFQAKHLIREHGLILSDLEENPSLDIAFDGADEVDTNLTLIKGGGGCLTQEKIVASAAKRLIIVADYTKKSKSLGEQWKKGIPIEVIPMAYKVVQQTIHLRLGGSAHLRMAKAKAGPLVTDNGNFILDWQFEPSTSNNWQTTDSTIHMIPGVVETGLFIGMASKVYVGNKDGTVQTI